MAEINWEVRAVALELLAFSFRYPESALVDAVMSGEWADAAREIAEALDVVPPASLSSVDLVQDKDGNTVDNADAFLHTLRGEATRLFVGVPEAVVSPYEGVWGANDDGVTPLLFVNPRSMAVERFLKSCGLGQPEGTNEPLDHIATELEFLQYLASLESGIAAPMEGALAAEDLPGGSAAATYAQFVEEHLSTWASRFAAATQEEARIPFYKAVGQLLEALLPALSQE